MRRVCRSKIKKRTGLVGLNPDVDVSTGSGVVAVVLLDTSEVCCHGSVSVSSSFHAFKCLSLIDLVGPGRGIGQCIVVHFHRTENIGVSAPRNGPNTSRRFEFILCVGRGFRKSNVSIAGKVGYGEMCLH